MEKAAALVRGAVSSKRLVADKNFMAAMTLSQGRAGVDEKVISSMCKNIKKEVVKYRN
jgi:hypothetical protein